MWRGCAELGRGLGSFAVMWCNGTWTDEANNCLQEGRWDLISGAIGNSTVINNFSARLMYKQFYDDKDLDSTDEDKVMSAIMLVFKICAIDISAYLTPSH